MGQITIQESSIDLTNDRKGKIAVLMYVGEDDPVAILDEAVSQYVGHEGYSEFIDINMDNPWVRVVMSGINEMKQVPYNPATHNLKL
jgi:hypothetical protein